MFHIFRSTTAYRALLVALVIALGVSLAPGREAQAAGWTTALVTCSSDDVKTAPDIYAQTMATYYRNQTVTVTGERTADGIWARVALPDGRLGWMKVVCVAGTVEPTPPSAPTGHTAVINTGALNVRGGPGWWYPILGTFYRGTTLSLGTYRNADASWVQVIMPNGQTGWVNARYILTGVPVGSLPVYGTAPQPPTPPTGATATILTGALNVRNGPGWWYGILATYQAGTTLNLTGYRSADSGWVQIILPWHAATGWVNARYVALSVPIGSLQVMGTTPPAPQPPTTPGYRTHVVQAGENLYRIGLRYGVSWPQIAAANGIGYPYRITVGQVLIIP